MSRGLRGPSPRRPGVGHKLACAADRKEPKPGSRAQSDCAITAMARRKLASVPVQSARVKTFPPRSSRRDGAWGRIQTTDRFINGQPFRQHSTTALGTQLADGDFLFQDDQHLSPAEFGQRISATGRWRVFSVSLLSAVEAPTGSSRPPGGRPRTTNRPGRPSGRVAAFFARTRNVAWKASSTACDRRAHGGRRIAPSAHEHDERGKRGFIADTCKPVQQNRVGLLGVSRQGLLQHVDNVHCFSVSLVLCTYICRSQGESARGFVIVFRERLYRSGSHAQPTPAIAGVLRAHQLRIGAGLEHLDRQGLM